MWNLEIFSQQKVKALAELGRISPCYVSRNDGSLGRECTSESNCKLSRRSSTGGEDRNYSDMDYLVVGLAAG